MLELVHSRTIRFARLSRDFDTSKLLDVLVVTAIALDVTIKQNTNAIATDNHFLIKDLPFVLVRLTL
jgi:hypothetical protein